MQTFKSDLLRARFSPLAITCAVIGLSFTMAGLALAEGTIQFAFQSYRATEGLDTVALAVKCNGATNDVTVHYTTADGNATNGIDYVASAGVLTFHAGETNLPVLVSILNDGVNKGNRAFQVLLGDPSPGAVLSPLTNATVLITDNDSGVAISQPNYTVSENGGTVTIMIARGDDGEGPASVDVATSDVTAQAGVDYTAVSNTVSFSSIEAFRLVQIPVLNNNVRDGSRSFRVSISNPQGIRLGSQTATIITIADDDQGFRLESSTNSVSEDAGFVFVKVLRSVDLAGVPATVDYGTTNLSALSGTDYTAVADTLSFAAGESEKLVPIPITNDPQRKSTRMFRFGISNPSGGEALGTPALTTISIYDKDPGVSFVPARVANEPGESDVTLSVVRGSDQFLGPFTVDYATADGSAKAGIDYEAASRPLSFGENETVKELTIHLLQNRPAQGTKTLLVALSNPSGGLNLGAAYSAMIEINGAYATVAGQFDPKLTLRAEPGACLMSWTGGGQLQRADKPTGPWQPLISARSPWSIQPSARGGFYRVKTARPAPLYVPSSYDGHTPMPLVIALHGYTSSGVGMEGYVHLTPLAESRGFLYCYPDGTFGATGNRYWSVFVRTPEEGGAMGFPYVDDVGYLRGIIEDVSRRFAVDRRRIYLIGHSNGAYMAHWFAFNHADLVAGIAALAGTVPAIPGLPQPSEPVNVLQIHGTADASVSYNDFLVWAPQGPLFGGAMHTIQRWAHQNGAAACVTDPGPTLDLDQGLAGLDTTVTRYTQCPPGGAVELWTINGGAHTPNLSAQFSPSVIDWLLAHPKP